MFYYVFKQHTFEKMSICGREDIHKGCNTMMGTMENAQRRF
jgi:hypothetical protein